jgi:hypothetical protein
MEVHPGPMKVNLLAVKAHPGAKHAQLEPCMLTCSHAHPGAFHGHPKAIEAHPGAAKAHPGALHAHQRALKAHPVDLHVHLEPFSFILGPGRLTLNP